MTLIAPRADTGDLTGSAEIIIDNPDAEVSGSWSTSSFQPNFYGANYLFTNRSAFSMLPRVVRWRPSLPAPGEYTVSLWLPDGNGDRSTAVKFRVLHAGEVSEFVIDQTVLGGSWRRLGRGPLTFTGAGDEYVELRAADVAPRAGGGALYIQADAVRFATPPPPLTSAPDLAVERGRNWAEVSWPALSGADSYLVSRSVDGSALEEVAEGASRAYVDLDMDPDRSYTYVVSGINDAGVGPAAQVDGVALVPGPPLQAVQGADITNVDGLPHLQWRPSRDARGYAIERSSRSGGNFAQIANLPADVTEFTDVDAPKRAHYVIRSTNGRGAAALGSRQLNWFG
ncbi:hypothetical protein [Agromyces sp. SYSU T00266]|uniref:golvesin C-terminal-like domain-containing protein n=1 Tax=Agromyces zhanjiangensis TaxID=3158562 RepID=UPI0033978BDF